MKENGSNQRLKAVSCYPSSIYSLLTTLVFSTRDGRGRDDAYLVAVGDSLEVHVIEQVPHLERVSRGDCHQHTALGAYLPKTLIFVA